MFLRCTKRLKDGKEHLYWSIVENRRVNSRQVVQRHVLYLGELNGRQEASWRKTIEIFGQDEGAPQQVALFPEEHAPNTWEVEQAFKELKHDLGIRPVKSRLKLSASGLTPRNVLEKFATVSMLDVHLPTTDGREVVMSRDTQPHFD